MKHVEIARKFLQDRLGIPIPLEIERGDPQLAVNTRQLLDVLQVLKEADELDYDLLMALTAVDYWPEEPRFAMVYQLYSTGKQALLGIRVRVEAAENRVPSVVSVYPNANWHEREVFDMFGIHFEDHPDLRRIIMPYDWQGHPLRKDYPLGYEEVQFTFNYDEIDAKKKYAKD